MIAERVRHPAVGGAGPAGGPQGMIPLEGQGFHLAAVRVAPSAQYGRPMVMKIRVDSDVVAAPRRIMCGSVNGWR